MSETPGDRRLTPAQILLIAVVSALVLLFVVLLAGRLTGGSGEPAADATTARDAEPAATAPDAAEEETSDVLSQEPADESEPAYFASPSGNIVCSLTIDSTDCVISSFDYAPEDAVSCDGDSAGGHLRVEPAGASMPCEPLVVAGDVPALDYGQTTTAHGYTCASDEAGVTCRHDESGYGFSVARAAYDLF